MKYWNIEIFIMEHWNIEIFIMKYCIFLENKSTKLVNLGPKQKGNEFPQMIEIHVDLMLMDMKKMIK